MKNQYNVLNHKQVDELLDLLFSDNISAQESEEIRLWLSNENNETLEGEELRNKFYQIHEQTDNPYYAYSMWPDLAERLGLNKNLIHRVQPVPPTVSHRLKMRKWLSYASVLFFILLFIGSLFYMRTYENIEEDLFTEITVLAGESREVLLDDGSQLELYENSSVRYKGDLGKDREIFLEGEAYFNVSKIEGASFRIITSSITVDVLGTEFTMRSFSGDPTAEVTLKRGSVTVTADGIEETLISPGQHFVYHKSYKTVRFDEINDEQMLRLRRINLSFDGESLDDVFRMVNEFYGVPVIINDNIDLDEKIRVSANDDMELEQMLSIIKLICNTKFDFSIQDEKVLITAE